MHGLTLPINEQVKQRIQSASAAQISVILRSQNRYICRYIYGKHGQNFKRAYKTPTVNKFLL